MKDSLKRRLRFFELLTSFYETTCSLRPQYTLLRIRYTNFELYERTFIVSGGIPQEIKAVWEPDLSSKINECIWKIDALERDLKVNSFSSFLFPGGLGRGSFL